MNIEELKSILSRYGIKPDKRMGQNFLLSDEVLEEIVDVADLQKTDTVLEIGPGLGALTRKLGERVDLVLAVEKDVKMAEVLRRIFRNKKNVKIIREDILNLISNSQFPIFNYQIRADYKVVANIPYYLTGKIVREFLQIENKPELMVLMLQKEVAERIVATDGNHSILSISVHLFADPEIVSMVSRRDFYPVPEVDSAVIKLRINDKPKLDVEPGKFLKFVKIGFSSPRKMLVNNLKSLRPKKAGDWKSVMTELGIDLKIRAQNLSLREWKELYDAMDL